MPRQSASALEIAAAPLVRSWRACAMRAASAALMLVMIVGGCTQSNQRPRNNGWRGEASRDGVLTIDEAQSAVMSLSETVMLAVADSCNTIIRRTDRPDARVEAATTRFGTALGSLGAATAPNMYVGFVDLITLVVLNRMSLEEPWARELYDEQDRVLLHRTFGDMERELFERAARVWSPEQLEELKEMIVAWREANPDRYALSSVRLLEFANSRQMSLGGSISSAPISLFRVLMLDPAANLSPATRELAESRLLAERLAFFGKRLPLVLGWQVELIGIRAVNSKAAQAIANESEQVLDAVTEISGSAQRLAASYERTLDEFPKERAAAIEQVNQALADRVDGMVTQTTAAIAAERQAAVDQMQAALTQSLKDSIDRLSERFEAQSSATIDRTAAIMAQERQQLSEQLAARLVEADAKTQRLADRIATNLLMVIVIGAVAVAVIVFISRRIESRFAARK